MTIKRFLYIIAIILVSGLLIQIVRTVEMQHTFGINFETPGEEFTRLNSKLPQDFFKVLVIYSQKDATSKKVYENIQHTFRLSKINYSSIPVDSTRLKDFDYSKYDLVVFATHRLEALKDYSSVINYVKKGGRLVFAVRSYFPVFDEMVGIQKNRGLFKKSKGGFKDLVNIFPGISGIKLEGDIISHSMLDVELQQDVKVLAQASSQPLIWEHDFDKGRVLYFNSTLVEWKAARGILIQYISYMCDYFAAAVFNGKMFCIDDFPAPIREGRDPGLYKQYGMNIRDFYRHIWWSAIYNLDKKYDLKYTGLIISTYNDDTTSPLNPINPNTLVDLKYYGRKLTEIRGEIGIHGYNHIPLVLTDEAQEYDLGKYGYKPWESEVAMEEGLRILKGAVKDIYGNAQIYTYVPPSNMLSIPGKRAVKHVFKDIKVFAGLYYGNQRDVLIQEFGKDPHVDGVYDIPRLSAGYVYSKGLMWDIYNGIAQYGVFSHFIHPDDVLDIHRSKGRTWRQMEQDLDRILSEIYTKFPFLRPMTYSQAYENYLKLEKLKVYTYKKGDTVFLHCREFVSPVYFYFRLREGRVVKVEGGSFNIIDKNSRLYLIQGVEPKISIKIR